MTQDEIEAAKKYWREQFEYRLMVARQSYERSPSSDSTARHETYAAQAAAILSALNLY